MTNVRTLFFSTLMLCCCLLSLNVAAQCTLAIDSVQSTNVTCNGLSNGAITVFSHGAHGSTTYSNGTTGTTISAVEQFNTSASLITSGNSTARWYSPSGCTYGGMNYYATGGCTGGAVGFLTSKGGGALTCYLRSPTVSATGLTQVALTFDMTNSASVLNDSLGFSIWSNISNSYQTVVVSSVNGVATRHLPLTSARNCQTMTVVFDITNILAANRASLLFYINPTINELNGASYTLLFDNMTLSAGTGSQTNSSFTGLAAGTYPITVTDSAGCTATTSVVITQPAALTLALVQDSVKCNGQSTGKITATGGGGTAPYTYSSNGSAYASTNIFGNLPAGGYTIYVKDANGCGPITSSITILQPAALSANIPSQTNVACNGGSNGSINVTASGGNGGYTYTWSTSPVQTTATALGLIAGTYTVTVTDRNACSVTRSTTITQPSAISVIVGPKAASATGVCDGADTANVTGGTVTYTYQWGTGATAKIITGLCAGSYCLTVYDGNGCTATACGLVTQPNNCAVTFGTVTSTNITCNGSSNGTITASATSTAGGVQYALNSGAFQSSGSFTGLPAGTYTVKAKDTNCTSTYSAVITIVEPIALTATITSVINATCTTTGAATAVANGGSGSYTYKWNTTPAQTTASATGLSAGTYTVTVTDANACSTTSSVTVNSPPALSIMAMTTDNRCNNSCDGSISLMVTGGTPAYTFSWNTVPAQNTSLVNNLCAGTYTVTVTDANNCTATNTATIQEPAPLALTFGIQNPSAHGACDGKDTVYVTGGVAPYTYVWNTNPVANAAAISNLCAGTYGVTITDANGCTSGASNTIIDPSSPGCAGFSVTATTTNAPCNGVNGGTITVATTGGTAAYSYILNNGTAQAGNTFSNLAAGQYIVYVTDANNCADRDTVVISQPAALSISLLVTAVTHTGAIDGTVSSVVLGGTAPYTYTWTNGDTTANISGLGVGAYCATITDANGCAANACDTVGIGTGINTVPTAVGVNVYPNPFAEQFTITVDGSLSVPVQVELFDLYGRMVYAERASGNTTTISTSSLAQGVYVMHLNINGQWMHKQIVKQ